jgi:hypothetical protein
VVASRDIEEDIVFGKRFARGLVLVVVALALGVSTGAAFAAQPPDWQKALNVRSKALDHKYRLDKYAGTLARRYHLGGSTRTSASAGAPDWLTALVVRSDALDREYGLGPYAGARK